MRLQVDLLRGLDAKQPKLVASTVTALKQIVTLVSHIRHTGALKLISFT